MVVTGCWVRPSLWASVFPTVKAAEDNTCSPNSDEFIHVTAYCKKWSLVGLVPKGPVRRQSFYRRSQWSLVWSRKKQRGDSREGGDRGRGRFASPSLPTIIMSLGCVSS